MWIYNLTKKKKFHSILRSIPATSQAPADYHKNNKLFKLWNKKPLQSTQSCLFYFIIQQKKIWKLREFAFTPHSFQCSRIVCLLNILIIYKWQLEQFLIRKKLVEQKYSRKYETKYSKMKMKKINLRIERFFFL